jgi:hypothetical protein
MASPKTNKTKAGMIKIIIINNKNKKVNKISINLISIPM